MKKYRDAWTAYYAKNSEHFAKIATQDPFSVFTGEHLELGAVGMLHFGLRVLCGGGPKAIAEKLLENAVELADKAEKTAPFKESGSVRAQVLRSRAFANGFLRGESRVDELLRAAGFLAAYTAEKRSGAFDAQQQSLFLSAVRLMLALGEQEQAAALLAKRGVLKAHAAEAAVLRQITKDCKTPGTRHGLDVVFDEMRDPANPPARFTDTPLGIIELALLRDRLFEAPEEPLDWERLISAIAA